MTDSPRESRRAIVAINSLAVSKNEKTICSVSELTINEGERLAVVGPNGSGKSTLLRVLAGLESDSTGNFKSEIPQRDVVYVHQAPFLFRGTVQQNVEYGLKARSVPRAARHEQAQSWLKRVGIAELADRDVKNLSGGECRRAALARACVLTPKLLLLDEPLADLDEAGIEAVRLALAGLSDSTIVIASPTALPSGIADRTFEIQPA